MNYKKVNVEIEIHYVWTRPYCNYENNHEQVDSSNASGDELECDCCGRKCVVGDAT